QSFRRWRDLAHPEHQLGSRHVYAGRDGNAPVLVERPAVEHDEIASCAHHLVELIGGNARRPARMLHELAECLARHVDAREQLQPGLLPRRYTAREREEVFIVRTRRDPAPAFATPIGLTTKPAGGARRA